MPKLDVTVLATIPDTSKFAGKYELAIGSCTGRDDLDIRRETGWSLIGLMQEVQKDRGLALTAVCVVAWLVRRRKYPDMTFSAILDDVTWDSDFAFDIVEIEDDESGKAGGGSNIQKSSPPSPTSTESDPGRSTT